MIKALLRLILGGVAAAMPGCTLVPTTEFNACQAENRNLADQNRAQLAEIENLKVHSRDLEDRVIRSERQLARLQEQANLDQKQLEAYQRERDGLYEQFKGDGLRPRPDAARTGPATGRTLAALSRTCNSIPETGISKLDTDILFDSGEAVLKPGAERVLDELARVLRSPAAGELKIMVAGHTDNQPIVGREGRGRVSEQLPPEHGPGAGRGRLAASGRRARAAAGRGRLSVPASPSPRTSRPPTGRRTAG